MKFTWRPVLLSLPALTYWCGLAIGCTGDGPPAGPLLPVARPVRYPVGPSLNGTLLTPPGRVLYAPQAARIERFYGSEEQRMRAGAIVVRVALKPFNHPQRSYWLAPAAGEIHLLGPSAGDYLAAQAPYARLRLSSPVRVLVAAGSAVGLRVGDSLVVRDGPAGLVGISAPITAIGPGAGPGLRVLFFNTLRWPRDTTARVVLVPVLPAEAKDPVLASRAGHY